MPSTNCNGYYLNWKRLLGNIVLNLEPNKFTTKYFGVRYLFWVDYYLAYLTTTKYYDPAHVWIWKHIWSRVTTKCKGTWSWGDCKNHLKIYLAEDPSPLVLQLKFQPTRMVLVVCTIRSFALQNYDPSWFLALSFAHVFQIFLQVVPTTWNPAIDQVGNAQTFALTRQIFDPHPLTT